MALEIQFYGFLFFILSGLSFALLKLIKMLWILLLSLASISTIMLRKFSLYLPSFKCVLLLDLWVCSFVLDLARYMCFYTHTRVLQCPWSMGKPGKGNGCPHYVANSFAMGFFSETGACSLSYVSKSWWPSCFCPTSQAQCRYDVMPGFSHQCWHLNSGPHIFVTNTPTHWCLPNLTSMSLAILKLSLGIGPGLYSSRAVFTHLRPLFSGFLFWCFWPLCSLWLFWMLLSWNYAILYSLCIKSKKSLRPPTKYWILVRRTEADVAMFAASYNHGCPSDNIHAAHLVAPSGVQHLVPTAEAFLFFSLPTSPFLLSTLLISMCFY